MILSGKYEHTLDDRGRVAIPALYRHLFTEGVMLAEGPEGCVLVYTKQDFELAAQEYMREPVTSKRVRDLQRSFFPSAWPADLDRQGRVLVPAALRQWAELNGAVVVCGRGVCLEIWNPQRWQEAKAHSARVAAGEAE